MEIEKFDKNITLEKKSERQKICILYQNTFIAKLKPT